MTGLSLRTRWFTDGRGRARRRRAAEPTIRILSTFALFNLHEQVLDCDSEGRQVSGDDGPDGFEIDIEIIVHQNVA
jgi:hypothetical protein